MWSKLQSRAPGQASKRGECVAMMNCAWPAALIVCSSPSNSDWRREMATASGGGLRPASGGGGTTGRDAPARGSYKIHVDAEGQVREVKITTRGARIFRVDVQVGVERHRRNRAKTGPGGSPQDGMSL